MESREVTVESIKAETPDVKTYTLRFKDPDARFEFLPGQFVMIEVPCVKDGKAVTLKRAYSIASTPSQTGSIKLTIKRQGIVTTQLDSYSGGEELRVTGPFGKYVHQEGMSKNVMGIAAGVGIAPIWTIFNYILEKDPKARLTLLCSNKTPHDVIHKEEIKMIQDQHPGVKIAQTITRPHESTPEELAGWKGKTGRIDKAMLKELVEERRPEIFYICGWPEMVDDCSRHLHELGIDECRIHTEKY